MRGKRLPARTYRPVPKTRILVIDDDRAVCTATTMLLESKGYDVVTAADGKSGVAAIKAAPFDLVIVDLFMPGMDGLETTKAIQRHNRSVPVIWVSGFMLGNRRLEMPNFAAMAKEAGALATLYKPFQPPVLFEAIQKALAGPASMAGAG